MTEGVDEMGNPQHKTIEVKCPSCGELVDGASVQDGGESVPPSDGDVGICLYCSCISVFEVTTQTMRTPTSKELSEFLSNREVLVTLMKVFAYRYGSD